MSASIAMMSGRGTITSRTIVSPNSKIEWISSFSPSSICSSSDATSAIARSSCSVTNGPCFRPLPGMITFAIFTQSGGQRTDQAAQRRRSGAPANSATRSVCWIANVFGVTSAKTKSRRVMASVAMISPAPWNTRTASEVAIVVPPIVESNMRRSTTLRTAPGSRRS